MTENNPLNIQTFSSRNNKKLKEYLQTNTGRVTLHRELKEGRIVQKKFEFLINPKSFDTEQTDPSVHLLQLMLYTANWLDRWTSRSANSKEAAVKEIRLIADKLTALANGWETLLHMNQDEEITEEITEW